MSHRRRYTKSRVITCLIIHQIKGRRSAIYTPNQG
nr:MAG TPA: hypothetical protein [Caudoviricetes sp.]